MDNFHIFASNSKVFIMESIIITSANKTDLKLLTVMAKRIGLKINTVSEEELKVLKANKRTKQAPAKRTEPNSITLSGKLNKSILEAKSGSYRAGNLKNFYP